MTAHFYRVLVLAFLGACPLAGAGVIPEGYPVDRYSSLWKHSPFTIASVQKEVVPAGFATKFVLVGVAKIGTEDIATLLNKESQERITVSSKGDKQDFKLVSVEQDADPLKTSVTLQKGDEVGKVKFDQALLGAVSPQVPTGGPQPPLPVQNMGQGAPPIPAPPVLRVRRSLPIPSPYQPPPTGANPPLPH